MDFSSAVSPKITLATELGIWEPVASDPVFSRHTQQPNRLPPSDFDSGIFTVGDSGQVTVDFLIDGGAYQGELALFSLRGMGALTGQEFIREAANRALSHSEWGHVIISDRTQGAKYDTLLGEKRHYNSGNYVGPQTFDFVTGDTLGLMLVPDGTVEQVYQKSDRSGKTKPLFSMATANSDSSLSRGLIADVTGTGTTFGIEDQGLDHQSDRDYNDLVFQLLGVEANVETLDTWINPEKDWRNTNAGQALIEHISLPIEPTTGVQYKPHELLLKVADGVTDEAITTVMTAHGATTLHPLVPIDPQSESPLQQWRLVTFDPDVDVLTLPASLTQDPHIEAVDLNVIFSVAATPDDTDFDQQWALDNTGQQGGLVDADIDALEAWDISTGSSDVVVAVLDTGIDYEHPDLKDNIWINSGEIANNGLDDDGNGYIDDVHGHDFSDENIWPNVDGLFPAGDPRDTHGHGTHVAGTIGAIGDNNLGVTGVSPNVSLMAVQALGDVFGKGSLAEILAAIDYALVNGADVINASFGSKLGPWGQLAMQDALLAALAEDVLVVAAAGNQQPTGNDNDVAPFYPASIDLPNVISVAATDRFDQLAPFSNYGATSVHLAAPGAEIWSTLPSAYKDINPFTGQITWKQKPQAKHYGSFSGTSMAAPHASGAAALMLSTDSKLSAEQLKGQLLRGIDPLASLQNKTTTGGRLRLPQPGAVKVGDAFRVGSVGTPQYLSSITSLDDGGFVVTWESDNQDSDGRGIFARRYDSLDNAVNDEFQVNSFTSSHQSNSSVINLKDNGFAVTWYSTEQDGHHLGIFAQRYDSSGSPAGNEFQVNSFTDNVQHSPSIASLKNGDFVITWTSFEQDGDRYGIFAQRYDSLGNPIGGEFQVNSFTTGDQVSPSIANLSDGGFLITWTSGGFYFSDDDREVFAQRYDDAGQRVGSAFQVNSSEAGGQNVSSAIGLSNGGFVVAWQSTKYNQNRGNEHETYLRVYSQFGNPVDKDIKVSNIPNGNSSPAPVLTSLDDGGFLVVWSSYPGSGNSYGIYAQRYNALGEPVGSEIPISLSSGSYSNRPPSSATLPSTPSVTTLHNGDFVVAWRGWGGGIFAHRFSLAF